MNYSIFQDRDDFQIRENRFILPADSSKLDLQSKRAMAICNLFVNYQYDIQDIARLLDENRRNVVLVLIDQGIIKDRRGGKTKAPDGRERRKPLVSPKVTLRTA